jgi:hypothetical protein
MPKADILRHDKAALLIGDVFEEEDASTVECRRPCPR